MGYHGHFVQNRHLADETHPSEKTHSMVRCGHSQEKNMVQNGFEGDGINPLIYLVFIKVPLVNYKVAGHWMFIPSTYGKL